MNNDAITRIKVNQSKLRSTITQMSSKRLALRGVGNGGADFAAGQIIALAEQSAELIDALLKDVNARAAKRDGAFVEYETRTREG